MYVQGTTLKTIGIIVIFDLLTLRPPVKVVFNLYLGEEMTKLKVSVIIPCYNVATWITECLDSVIQQTLKEIEIICIDDGSTDETGAILESYAKRDKRVIVWSQQNSGVSVARNRGIEMAKAPYIMFVDPDDWIDKDCIRITYDEITRQNVDMVIFCYNYMIDGQEKDCWLKPWIEKHANNSSASLNLDMDTIPGCTNCWGKLIQRDFLLTHKIRFPVGIKIAEDGIFCQTMAFYHPTFVVLNQYLYKYRAWNGITGQQAEKCIQYNLEALKYFHNQPIFQTQPIKTQMVIINKFISGTRAFWNRNRQHQAQYKKDIDDYYQYLTENYPLKNLEKAPLFKWLSHTHRGISKLALIRLLGFLPLGHWIDKKTKKSFKIIGLPLFKIKKKQQKTIYFFCGIPIIKIQW